MKIGQIIRGWYEKNKRDLPMRRTRDPYLIWVAEVIMQQTRMNQGLGYYLRFVDHFPDVTSLASAREDEVLKLWQGLGYYSRARNLHQAARDIVEQMGGELPGNYQEWLELKGVGPYTAAAIASFCYGEPVAAVDGNVSRVIARVFGVEEPIDTSRGGKLITSLAQELLDHEDPGIHNQAMIEFGALQCVPVSPKCNECPLQQNCMAHQNGTVDQLPVKIPKRKPSRRWFYYYIITGGGEIAIIKRSGGDIWQGLYQFPVLESPGSLNEAAILEQLDRWLDNQAETPEAEMCSIEHISPVIKHQLTHMTIHARFVHVRLQKWPRGIPSEWITISRHRVADFPFPRLINRYMEVVKF
jgi:A/G-specific adenine glycosylase